MQVATVSSRSWLVQLISVAARASLGTLWKVFWMCFQLLRCCLLLAHRGDPCGMGFGVFCDASLLRISRE